MDLNNGVQRLVIRTFQPGDTLLLQRVQRQAPKLNVAQSLILPRSAVWVALSAANPLNHAKVATYVLHQNGHGLARSGFLQVQRRPGRGESDILLLAPALDTRTGHPAIWEKLLAHCIVEATQEGIARIYADVPDQPLPVNTFAHVGFSVFARQSVWRLAPDDVAGSATLGPNGLKQAARVRPVQRSDEWELMRLYARVTPKNVQAAEGTLTDTGTRPPILDWWQGGDVQTFVSGDGGGSAETLNGCLRIVTTRKGVWMQLWADAHRNDADAAEALLCAAVKAIHKQRRQAPIYMPVREYQGGLGPLLNDYGFAPFADHAKMVKHLLQRVVDMESVRQHSVEPASEVVVTAGGYRAPLAPPMPRTRSEPRERPLLRRRLHGDAHLSLHAVAAGAHAPASAGDGPEQSNDAHRL